MYKLFCCEGKARTLLNSKFTPTLNENAKFDDDNPRSPKNISFQLSSWGYINAQTMKSVYRLSIIISTRQGLMLPG